MLHVCLAALAMDRYLLLCPPPPHTVPLKTRRHHLSPLQHTHTHNDILAHPSLQGHSHLHMDSVVKIKSLPFDATQLDIITFFESFRLKPNGVQLVVRSDNKATGEVG